MGDGGFPHTHPTMAERWGSAGCQGDGGQEVAGAEETTGSSGALGLCATASVLVHGPFITHRNPPLLLLQRLQAQAPVHEITASPSLAALLPLAVFLYLRGRVWPCAPVAPL